MLSTGKCFQIIWLNTTAGQRYPGTSEVKSWIFEICTIISQYLIFVCPPFTLKTACLWSGTDSTSLCKTWRPILSQHVLIPKGFLCESPWQSFIGFQEILAKLWGVFEVIILLHYESSTAKIQTRGYNMSLKNEEVSLL